MYLTKEQMEKLNTKRLLAYFKKNLHYGRSPCKPWCWGPNCEEICEDGKEAKEFEEARNNAKLVLASRENLEKAKPK